MERDALIEAILEAALHARPASHVPGRVRLKVYFTGLGVIKRLAAGQVLSAAERIEGVRSMHVHPLARSLLIEYDPSVIEPAFWDRLAALREHPEDRADLRGRLERLLSR